VSEYFNDVMDCLAYWMEGNPEARLSHSLSINGEEKYVLTYTWNNSKRRATYESIEIEAKELTSDETYRFYLNVRIGKPLLHKLQPNWPPQDLVDRLIEYLGAVIDE